MTKKRGAMALELDFNVEIEGASADEVEAVDYLAPLRPTRVVLDPAGHVGQALRAARESLSLEVDDIASATRVRASHLSALEAFELDALPARPFAIGYVRAYALALGLDGDTVVARFRREAPKADATLRAPGGVVAGPRQWGWVIPPAVLIVVALVGWNLLRHFGEAPSKPITAISGARAQVKDRTGPMTLGPPLPQPVETGAPPVYHTPGLSLSSDSDAAPSDVAVGAAFVPAGAIYGAPKSSSAPSTAIVLQAKRATSLIVRAAESVTFARELAPGEAWRAPAGDGLTVDVGSPSAVEVYVGGVARGVLVNPQTLVSKLSLPPSIR